MDHRDPLWSSRALPVLVSMLIGIGAAIVPFILVFALAAFPAWLPLGIWSLLLLAGSYAVYRRLIRCCVLVMDAFPPRHPRMPGEFCCLQ